MLLTLREGICKDCEHKEKNAHGQDVCYQLIEECVIENDAIAKCSKFKEI